MQVLFGLFYFIRTTIFQWCVVRCGFKNIHNERSFNVRVIRVSFGGR